MAYLSARSSWRRRRVVMALIFGLVAALISPAASAPAQVADEAFDSDITLTRWDDLRDFRSGTWENLQPGRRASLRIASAGEEPVSYTDPFGDGTPRLYDHGTWTSPVIEAGYAIDESVTSWNVDTPTGTWIEVEFRGRKADGTWTKWFVMGRWTAGDDFTPADGSVGDIHRTSVNGQTDDDAYLFTDTFVAKSGHEPEAFQTQITLLRPVGSTESPQVQSVTTMTNEYLPASAYPGTSEYTLNGEVDLDVPGFSQNIHRGEYPEFGGGGQVWCSPTSTSMVQYHYGSRYQVPDAELADIEAPAGDPWVDFAAINTWDYTYEGAGNWPFNTAYAHRWGLDGFVTRLRSLAEAERFIDAGIPLVFSANWDLEEMPEAGYDTDGHLLVLGGFTADGDPIIYDPAMHSNEDVRNVYTRENFERVWQTSTDGLTYVIHPPQKKLPSNVPGVTPNW